MFAGLLLSQSKGDGSYTQREGHDRPTVESTQTRIYPYTRFDLSERVSAWDRRERSYESAVVPSSAVRQGSGHKAARADATTRHQDSSSTRGAAARNARGGGPMAPAAYHAAVGTSEHPEGGS